VELVPLPWRHRIEGRGVGAFGFEAKPGCWVICADCVEVWR